MRIRTIKPDFFSHDRLFDLEQQTKLPVRLSYIGLWCVADREGRFKWEPRRMGIKILPYDGVSFEAVMDALLLGGFIVKYRVKSTWYGCIPSFRQHQYPNSHEAKSVLPSWENAEGFGNASGMHGACTVQAPCVNNGSTTPSPTGSEHPPEVPDFRKNEIKTDEAPKVDEKREGDTQVPSGIDITKCTCKHGACTVHAQGEGKGKEGEQERITGARSAPEKGVASDVPNPPPPQPTEPETPPDPPKPEKITDPTGNPHALFIARWMEEYPKHHQGAAYKITGGRDGASVKSLLKTGKTVDDLIRMAVAAWKSEETFWCKHASTIYGLNSRFNEIRDELNAGRKGSKKGAMKEGLKPKIATDL